MKVCPTNGLQAAQGEAGLEGLWTPIVMPRMGHCDYGCNACGQVCPSGAIPSLTLEQKRQAVIGTASVNRNRCLPWASATPCIVCEEMCPTPQKSIRLEEVNVTNQAGETVTLQRPYRCARALYRLRHLSRTTARWRAMQPSRFTAPNLHSMSYCRSLIKSNPVLVRRNSIGYKLPLVILEYFVTLKCTRDSPCCVHIRAVHELKMKVRCGGIA